MDASEEPTNDEFVGGILKLNGVKVDGGLAPSGGPLPKNTPMLCLQFELAGKEKPDVLQLAFMSPQTLKTFLEGVVELTQALHARPDELYESFVVVD